MTKKLKLSYSQISNYKDCQRLWYFDKVARIRPNTLGSALLLGTAFDNATEHILLKKEGDYLETFYQSMKKFEVNGKKKELPRDILDLKLFVSDIDEKLLSQVAADEYCEEIGIEPITIKDFLEYCKKKRKARSELSEVEQKLFNWMGYQSLLVKGELMLKAINEWIEENVAEVHAVQKKIELENQTGDKFVGYLDFIVTLRTDCETCGGDGVIEVFEGIDETGEEQYLYHDCPDCSPERKLIDLKSSSDPKKYYPDDAADKSPQLAIYSEVEKLPEVAYLVAGKKILVREPRVKLRFVEGKITEEFLDEVFDEIEEITAEIKEKLPLGKEAFEKNLDSCSRFGKCSHRDLCEKGSMKGLEKVK